MNRITTIGKKGQFVIPTEMRKSLRIGPGTRVALTLQGARIILEPVSNKLVDRTRGLLSRGPSLVKVLHQERQADNKKIKW